MSPYKITSIILLLIASLSITACGRDKDRWNTRTVQVQSYAAPTPYATNSAPYTTNNSAPYTSNVAPQPPQSTSLVYTVGHGDRLQVRVFGEPSLTGEYGVDGTGIISMPLLRSVQVAGMTTQQVEQRISDRLKEKFLRNPNVSVEIRSFRPFYILGEVNRAGQYPYVDGMSVQTAVAIAGGYTARAKRSKVKVTRRTSDGGSTSIKLGKSEIIYPGDTIIVGERFF